MKIAFLIFTVLFVVFTETCADDEQGLQIVSRKEWSTYGPKNSPSKLQTLPSEYVIVAHTVSNVCLDKSKCIHYLKNMLDLHVKQYGWNDIAYNFLIGGDGMVYEGRGWDVEGAHTKGYNVKSIGIAFIGDFIAKSPSKTQTDAALKLLEHGVKENKLAKNYKLLGQKQVSKTDSPGAKLQEVIKTWDHWSESA